MLQVDMPSALRTVFGKGAMRQLRMKEKIPGILYSRGQEPLALQFEFGQLHKDLLFIHSRNAVVTLQIDGDSKDKRHVLVQEIQQDPVTDRVIHVDFLEIELEQPLDFEVPLEFTGIAQGVELGGELQIFKNTIRLRGCPLDIPDTITADITELDQGGAGLTFGDFKVPDNIDMLDSAGVTCVTVY